MQPRFLLNLIVFCIFVFATLREANCKRYGKLLVARSRAMRRRMGLDREDLRPKVCFDLVGCFADPPPHLSLKRPPEHPSIIQTRFLLYTRETRNSPEILKYGDDLKSIKHSRFNNSNSLKVIIHGYKGSGNDAAVIYATHILLDTNDWNIIILDWTKGAATTYTAAVANTELVGRQLALILMDILNLGVDPKDIHLVGFSLGAHVAGCASEVLKKKSLLIGRITGLDPASPFFRHHLFREKSRKLDATDAQLVDVIHTDGSEDFADGFGLLKPIGHIDFFPNGGKQQPGCSDVKNSVVISHLKEDALTANLACSHLRAWWLFVESIRSHNGSCKFDAWPCPQGSSSYLKGFCFPMETTQWSQEMGMGSYRGPLGLYYLATRGEPPFCGQPFRASVITADGAPKTKGTFYMSISHRNATTVFSISCSLTRRRNDTMIFYTIAALQYESLSGNLPKITAFVWYKNIEDVTEENKTTKDISGTESSVLLINKLALEDRKGNRWEFCNPRTPINFREVELELYRGRCP